MTRKTTTKATRKKRDQTTAPQDAPTVESDLLASGGEPPAVEGDLRLLENDASASEAAPAAPEGEALESDTPLVDSPVLESDVAADGDRPTLEDIAETGAPVPPEGTSVEGASPSPGSANADEANADHAGPGDATEAAGGGDATEAAGGGDANADDDVEEARELTQTHLRGLLEALVFASDKPLKTSELARLASARNRQVKEALEELKAEYRPRGILLDEVAGGWLFRTNAQYAPFVRDLAGGRPVKLSRAQLETLAIAAYRQPITRPEIDEIRGVDSGATLKLLLERDLVRILGKKDEPGRPLLYGTTTQFLEFFNMKSLKDLPTLREFTELSDESLRVAEAELGDVFPGESASPAASPGRAEEGHGTPEGEPEPDADEPERDDDADPVTGRPGAGGAPEEEPALEAEPAPEREPDDEDSARETIAPPTPATHGHDHDDHDHDHDHDEG